MERIKLSKTTDKALNFRAEVVVCLCVCVCVVEDPLFSPKRHPGPAVTCIIHMQGLIHIPSSLKFSVVKLCDGTRHILIIFTTLTFLFCNEKKTAGKTFVFKNSEYYISLHIFYQDFRAIFCCCWIEQRPTQTRPSFRRKVSECRRGCCGCWDLGPEHGWTPGML